MTWLLEKLGVWFAVGAFALGVAIGAVPAFKLGSLSGYSAGHEAAMKSAEVLDLKRQLAEKEVDRQAQVQITEQAQEQARQNSRASVYAQEQLNDYREELEALARSSAEPNIDAPPFLACRGATDTDLRRLRAHPSLSDGKGNAAPTPGDK